MQHILTIDEILNRASAIDLRTAYLCDRAGVARSTISEQRRSGSEAKLSTLRKLRRALEAREIELRDYLVALHGAPHMHGEAAE